MSATSRISEFCRATSGVARCCGYAPPSCSPICATSPASPRISPRKRRPPSLINITLIGAARDLGFYRLGDVLGHLGREAPHLLRLSAQRAELLLPIGGMQLHRLGEVLGTGQASREIEPGIDVALGDVDDFAIEGHRAL